MVLSNVEILNCLKTGKFSIDPLAGWDPTKAPFNTSAVDLRLSDEVLILDGNVPFQLDLRKGNIAKYLNQHSKKLTITPQQGVSLDPNQLVLAKTLERVDFPLGNSDICYSARVEGKSSLARCGILVHFTAPTIHAGFQGTITLEIINLGPSTFLLTHEMYFCQLIIEEVRGRPVNAPNQFMGQTNAAGVIGPP